MDEPTSGQTLPKTTRRVHRHLTEAMLATGEVPPAAALAAALGLRIDALRLHLRTLADADYLGFDSAGHLTCLYPFSAVPTRHVVTFDGTRRFAMCSLDALGLAAMLGRPVEVESTCPVCGTPVRLTVRPGAVLNVEPPAAVVVAKRDGEAPAFEACCGLTVFACGPDHADVLLARTADALALDLPAALGVGETIFAGLLGDSLPAKRKRAPVGES